MQNSNSHTSPIVAIAEIKGSPLYPDINGTVIFKKKNNGILITAEILGLPYKNGKCNNEIFAFHIHSGISCTGNIRDPFADAGTHYNPNNCWHPNHAGDLPPLFGNNGYAYLSTYTNRFTIDEIIGKVVVIHDRLDDFTTQPSGNAGNKIACGKIVPF